MRAQLIGIEAVTAEGSVLRRLPGLVKDNTGYHLPPAGPAARARWRSSPAPGCASFRCGRAGRCALLAVDDAAAAVEVAGALRRSLPNLLAAELFFDDGMTLVLNHAGGDRPFREPHPAYLLVEADGATDPSDALVEAISASNELVRDVVVAADPAGRQRLWRLRERHTEAVNAQGVPHKLDVAVPDLPARSVRDGGARGDPACGPGRIGLPVRARG